MISFHYLLFLSGSFVLSTEYACSGKIKQAQIFRESTLDSTRTKGNMIYVN